VIIQWCIKGLNLDDDAAARDIVDCRGGILCNWWRTVGRIDTALRRERLTSANLNVHVNHFTVIDPSCGKPFSTMTPFISLSAGTVERDAAARTNLVHRARRTALWFGTEFGRRSIAFLYLCWVVLAPRQAVEIEGVGEEVRDLNTYRRYSAFQTEGEVVAKIWIPDNQIRACEKWTWDRSAHRLALDWCHPNQRFTPPERLSNVRELL